MSHIVSFRTSVKDAKTIRITAKRMGLPKPQDVEHYRMRAKGSVSGVSVQLPGWSKPVVFDTESGQVAFDNWSPYDENHPQVRAGNKQVGEDGRWGDIAQLNRFVDEYLGTGVMLQAEQEGHIVEEYSWDAENSAVKVVLKA